MGEPLTTFTAGDLLPGTTLNSNFQNARDGLLELICAEAIDTTTVPKPFYINSGSGWIGLCDGNDQTKLEFVGFVKSGQNVGAGAFAQVYMGEGVIVKGFSGLSRGSKYYVQDDGTIGTSVGTYEILVGIAISTTEIILVKGSFEYLGNTSSGGGTNVHTAPSKARIAIVKVFGAKTGDSSNGTHERAASIVISKVGATSNQASMIVQGSSGGGGYVNSIQLSASWSGDSITTKLYASPNGSADSDYTGPTITVYYYR
ncbi:MAG: hypothetical protein UV20_C0009G0011 [Candidatus Magasanikbacteria bacterium GW2011_GWA2_42_32]|uniref:Uncharacterized protein n=1 Tax=Candidatus Magasanikbacteria bacterium GW2011_GWA2_42_32 TaxID=1619039 RepID=A0A0G1A627_9BACT|nr:MAG: hypothetical protein UV20_C0009G0011 [Candidatus Magasanikbacteria bacterium GW2011_GWA2_42_32]HBX15915.1 hypothetical protein [Candidatus Magasanikbacteria bacterium]